MSSLDAFLDKINLPNLDDVEGATDRVVVIVLTSFISNVLTQAIIGKLVKDRRIIKRLFTGIGPLSSFFACIELGYLLALYSDDERKSLHAMRDIRNKFAHSSGQIDFDSEIISPNWAHLDFFKIFCADKKSRREQFIASAHYFMGHFIRIFSADEQPIEPVASPYKFGPPPPQAPRGPSPGRKKPPRQRRSSRKKS